jgi:predicted O-linked N-acetylglucosamine transferase (SPINDLY family)
MDVLHLAGVVAHKRGNKTLAIEFLTRAAESLTDPQPSLGLGHLLQEARRIEEAIAYFKRAVEIDPELYDARLALADALHREGKIAEAEAHLRRAIALRPDSFEAPQLLTRVLYVQARHVELAETVRTMQRIRPFDGGSIFAALLVPAINQSTQEIEEIREDLTKRIDELLEGPALSVSDPVTEIGITPFYLAYHGLNDCELQKRIVRLCRKAYCPAFSAPLSPRRHKGRIRIGFVSEHFNLHSVGRVNHGLISGLRRDKFEVTAFSLATHDDELARKIKADSDYYVEFDEEPLAKIEAKIAEHEMDVLFFTDVGMDPLTYFLAYSRLAPLQLVAWGHPDTTGIDTLDYYISADALELPDADSHYTEKLVRLPAWVMPGYQRPSPPDPLKPRSNFGLRDGAHVYVCPQQPFKIHPDFDEALATILRGDPNGVVALVEGRHANLTEMLKQRFQKTIADVAQRIRILPHMPWKDYLNLIAISDVMLDPLHFGGANTSYEGLAMGIPVVTLPPSFLRGRHTLGCYLKMGINECIASTPQHYADIALKLGTNADFRLYVVRKIEETSNALFENGEMAEALGSFLLHTCFEGG